MQNEIPALILNKDYEGIRRLLTDNPSLANEGIGLVYNSKAHPLHRLCDVVFAKKITDEEAVEIAKILFEFGADINGETGKDGPLLAAASLHAEKLGILYIEKGADIFYADKNDGATALHWAAFCGRDKLVEKLIQNNAKINQRDPSYNSTPIGWAIHALTSITEDNMHHQAECIKLLIHAGADITTLDEEKKQYLKQLA